MILDELFTMPETYEHQGKTFFLVIQKKNNKISFEYIHHDDQKNETLRLTAAVGMGTGNELKKGIKGLKNILEKIKDNKIIRV